MAWIFQGNPKFYKIDEYLKTNLDFIYWRTPQHSSEIKIGDRAYIWRCGTKEPGVIAIGLVAELPTKIGLVKKPELLGNDLWLTEPSDPEEIKTGIKIEEIRLTESSKMVPRNTAIYSLSTASIFKNPRPTVFKLTDEENAALETLWYKT